MGGQGGGPSFSWHPFKTMDIPPLLARGLLAMGNVKNEQGTKSAFLRERTNLELKEIIAGIKRFRKIEVMKKFRALTLMNALVAVPKPA
jgi:hypothetical protein